MKTVSVLLGVLLCFCFIATSNAAVNVETGEDVGIASDTTASVEEGDQVDVFHPETGQYDTEEVTSVDSDSGEIETDDMTEGVENIYDTDEDTPEENLDQQYGDSEDLQSAISLLYNNKEARYNKRASLLLFFCLTHKRTENLSNSDYP